MPVSGVSPIVNDRLGVFGQELTSAAVVAKFFHAHQPQGGPKPGISVEADLQGLVNGRSEAITGRESMGCTWMK